MINIKKFIKDNSDYRYAEFEKKVIKTSHQINGVRVPTLRKFAKELEPEYVEIENNPCYEEILLYGFAASYIKSEDEQIEYTQNLLPLFDDWSLVDEVVLSMKEFKTDKSYQFLTNLLFDDREYYVRTGVVGLMRHFLKTEKQEEILQNLRKVTCQAHYAKMAISWLYSELCTFNFERAKKEIEQLTDAFIRSRSISKACDSYRVDKPHKEELQKLRIK